jgi:hypothetical protein
LSLNGFQVHFGISWSISQVFDRTLWAASFGLVVATAVASCSPGPLIDKLPADMGLPAGAPARPDTPYQYPAVHDMPPDRASVPMSEEEQVRMEKELTNVRDRQEGRPVPNKKTIPAAKKPANNAENGQTAGAKPNP